MKKNLRLAAILMLSFIINYAYAQNGTANGTYHFGNLGVANSGGTGFKKQGDKFLVTNDYALEPSDNSLYDGAKRGIGGQSATLIIKAEGTSVCRRFNLLNMGLYSYAGGVYQSVAYSMFTISLYNEQNDLIASHSINANINIGGTNIRHLKDIPFTTPWPATGYNNVAAIHISFITPTTYSEVLGFSNLTVSNISAGTLPVTISSFTAKAAYNHAQLNWKTDAEENNKGFIIYRSGNDKNFQKIGELDSKGIPGLYAFVDQQPLKGDNYYRLVQVDFNGKVTIVAEKALSFAVSSLSLMAFPNPTINEVTLSFEPDKYNQLILSALSGEKLQSIELTPGQASLSLSLSNYTPGVYIVQLIGDGTHEVLKIIKK